MSNEICSGLQRFTASHDQVPRSLGRKAWAGVEMGWERKGLLAANADQQGPRRSTGTGVGGTIPSALNNGFPQRSPICWDCLGLARVRQGSCGCFWKRSLLHLPTHPRCEVGLGMKPLTCIKDIFTNIPKRCTIGSIFRMLASIILHPTHCSLWGAVGEASFRPQHLEKLFFLVQLPEACDVYPTALATRMPGAKYPRSL